MKAPFDIANAKIHPDDPKLFVTRTGEFWRRVNDRNPRMRQWKNLVQEATRTGHMRCRVAGKKQLVHRVVYRLFVGELEAGKVVCHLDGDPSNNTAGNLLQDTQKTNLGHKVLHCTSQGGARHGRAVHTEEQAALVRHHLNEATRLENGNLSRGERLHISAALGVSGSFITQIDKRGAFACAA